jgi:lysyl-tRNA synthetase class 2
VQHPDPDWRPTATTQALRQRAELLRRLRAYFAAAGVLEVDTPLLSQAGVTDPHIPSFSTRPGRVEEAPRYLNTSPEFAMKRLLAAGSGPIYQVCKAFRQGEQGRFHNPEFTLLEWYRPGFDHHRLMAEVAELVTLLAADYRALGAVEKLTYAECFQQHLDLDPHRAQGPQLKACAQAQGLGPVTGLADDDRDGWLDLLMSHCIQPKLGRECLTFVYNYPVSQAALARLHPGPPPVAERFELFVDGVELANGFHELRDPAEQRARFTADLRRREVEQMEPMVVDERLLCALAAGLPDCAGVALGLDRLQMVLTGASTLEQVLAFPFDRA